jgi:cation diffusion facilitator CzcD-associated flavoprotein CzcO
MAPSTDFDVVIIGGGPDGRTAPAYVRMADLTAVLHKKRHVLGGLWSQQPSCQDIQNREEDWTLGDTPIAGVDQTSILANIRRWASRFGLAEQVQLATPAVPYNAI